MNDLKRSTKILLGVATIWPLIYIFIFMAVIFGMMAFSFGGPPPDPSFGPIFGIGFMAFFVVHFLTIMLGFGMTIFYIIHAIKNENLQSDWKAIWAVLFFIAGMFAEPVYWYLQIWKAPDAEQRVGELSPAGTSTWDFESGRTRQGEYQPPPDPPDWR